MSRFKPSERKPGFGQPSNDSSSSSLRLVHKLNTARETGVLSLASMNLTSLPHDVFHLREGLLEQPAPPSRDARGNPTAPRSATTVKAWECFGEEMVTSVDVSENPLKLLPRDVSRFESCRKLRARRCELTAFDMSCVASMGALHSLDLSFNALSGCFSLSQLPAAMSELSIASNSIEALCERDENFSLPALQSLDASTNNLSFIPPSLLARSPLLKLNLSTNAISNIPNGYLPRSLQHLDLSKNAISDPPNLSSLSKLQFVDLSLNKLVSSPTIPPSVLNLNLSNNALRSIDALLSPECSSTPPLLLELRLRANRLSTLPPVVFTSMFDLSLLDLSDNDLSDVPSILGYLPALSKISLDGNCLRGPVRQCSDARSLKKSLRFKAPPPSSHPKYLSQDGGELEKKQNDARQHVAAARAAVGGGNVLDLNNAAKGQLPDEVLRQLSRRFNDEEGYYDQGDYEDEGRGGSDTHGARVKTFKARGNALTFVDPEWFEVLRGLQDLDLGKNRLDFLPENACALPLANVALDCNDFTSQALSRVLFPRGSVRTPMGMTLAVLDVSNNRLASFPEMIFDLPNLNTLNLSYNHITTLRGPGGWVVGGGMRLLNALDLSNNKIEDLGILPIDMFHKGNIRTLSLANNELRNIDLQLGNLSTLRNLDLRGNPQKQIRAQILEQGCHELLSYLKSKIDPDEQRLPAQQMAGNYGAAPTSVAGLGPGAVQGRAIVARGPGAGAGAGAPAAPGKTTVPASKYYGGDERDEELEKLRQLVDTMNIQVNNVHLTEAKKYAMKKEIARNKSQIIKLERDKAADAGMSQAAAFRRTFD